MFVSLKLTYLTNQGSYKESILFFAQIISTNFFEWNTNTPMFKPQFGWPCHFIDKNKRFLNIQQDLCSAETEHGETKGKQTL